MNCGLFFCLLLGHFISDFILQPGSMTGKRFDSSKKARKEANLAHATVYFFISIMISLYYFSGWLIICIAVLSLLHFLVDSLKSYISVKMPISRYRLTPFFLDQFLHLLSILAASIFVSFRLPVVSLMHTAFQYIADYINSCVAGITYSDRVTLSILLFIIGVWGAGYFIRLFFNKRKHKSSENILIEKYEKVNDLSPRESGTEAGGLIIGMLERAFIICSIVIGMNGVIGFVLATKSIARLKKFDDDRFVEDFIIGSLMSFLCAIIIGTFIKALKIYYVIG